MTIRLFCGTNLCTLQAAQLCHAQRTIATLTAKLDAVTAERDAMAARAVEAQESADFYMDLFCTAKEAQR